LEKNKKVIVDASVAVKCFVPKPYYEKAVSLRDAYLRDQVELIAPNLLVYEVANALRFHRICRFSLKDIVNAVRDLIDLGIIRRVTLRE